MRKALVLVCVAVVCAGCGTTREAQFGLIGSTGVGRNIQVPSVANVPVTAGESKGWTLLFLVPLSSRPTLQKAADDAMKKGGGNLIVDAEVESFFMDLILASQVGLRVKGKVVNVPK